jgi:hypothetical protein
LAFAGKCFSFHVKYNKPLFRHFFSVPHLVVQHRQHQMQAKTKRKQVNGTATSVKEK